MKLENMTLWKKQHDLRQKYRKKQIDESRFRCDLEKVFTEVSQEEVLAALLVWRIVDAENNRKWHIKAWKFFGGFALIFGVIMAVIALL